MSKISCVYAIENTKNGKRYIGSSVDYEKRKREHLNQLRKNKHHSIHLQRSWETYGEKSFKFEIMEICENLKLIREREEYWIVRFCSLNRNYGYNVSESTVNFSASGANHPLYGKDFKKLGYENYWKGKKIPEHIRQKMRKPRSDEARKNMSKNHADFSGKNNPMFGKKITEQHRKKISESLKGLMVGEKNPMFGRNKSGEFASNAKKVLQLTIDGVPIKEFINITEAAKGTGATRQHITKCCKGERNKTGGYKWEYCI